MTAGIERLDSDVHLTSLASPVDPLTFVAMAMALMTACIVAGGIPARRAARVKAIVALRGD